MNFTVTVTGNSDGLAYRYSVCSLSQFIEFTILGLKGYYIVLQLEILFPLLHF